MSKQEFDPTRQDPAALQLRTLGPYTRQLLAECVAQGRVTRHKPSDAVRKLVEAGFVNEPEGKTGSWSISPTSEGKQALKAYENLYNAAGQTRRQSPPPKLKLMFDTGLDVLKHRKSRGERQEVFWSRVGITQSGGSRYENERDLPWQVSVLLHLVYSGDDEALHTLDYLRRDTQAGSLHEE